MKMFKLLLAAFIVVLTSCISKSSSEREKWIEFSQLIDFYCGFSISQSNQFIYSRYWDHDTTRACNREIFNNYNELLSLVNKSILIIHLEKDKIINNENSDIDSVSAVLNAINVKIFKFFQNTDKSVKMQFERNKSLNLYEQIIISKSYSFEYNLMMLSMMEIKLSILVNDYGGIISFGTKSNMSDIN